MQMREPSREAGGTARMKRVGLVLLAGGAIGAASLLYITLGGFFKPQPIHGRGPAGESWVVQNGQPALPPFSSDSGEARAADAAAVLHVIPNLAPAAGAKIAPDVPFVDADGKPVNLSAYRGKVVLVNLWATWCAPCKAEMPELAKLQAKAGSRDFVVLPISIDSKRATDKAKAFIAQNAPLTFHQDAEYALPPALDPPVEGVPASFFLDRKGRVRARISGDADWTGVPARALIDKLLAE